jgi:AraC-like DNA-binding protein
MGGTAMTNSLFETLPEVGAMAVSAFDPVWSERLHDDPANELLCVTRGRLALEIADEHLDAGPGDLLFVPAGTQHRDVFEPHDDFEVFLVQFHWAAADAFFAEVSSPLLRRLPEETRADALRVIDQFRDESAWSADLDTALARVRLHGLLLLILRGVRRLNASPETDREDVSRQHRLMLDARRYLDSHYNRMITLDAMAEKLGVSTHYLSRVFNQESGFTLVSYLTALRMKKAKLLLKERRLNISEVAYAVGFETSGYFSRVFRRHVGVSPTEYRRGHPPPAIR